MKHETAENEILLSLPLTMRPKVLELAIWYLLLLSTRVQSFGSRLLNLFRPSSTEHLADLLELYDLVQDPSFLSKQRKLAFQSLLADVEVSSDGVVEGQGLIAKRDFSAGEVVAFYPYVHFKNRVVEPKQSFPILFTPSPFHYTQHSRPWLFQWKIASPSSSSKWTGILLGICQIHQNYWY